MTSVHNLYNKFVHCVYISILVIQYSRSRSRYDSSFVVVQSDKMVEPGLLGYQKTTKYDTVVDYFRCNWKQYMPFHCILIVFSTFYDHDIILSRCASACICCKQRLFILVCDFTLYLNLKFYHSAFMLNFCLSVYLSILLLTFVQRHLVA